MKPHKFIPLLLIAAGLLAYHNSFQGPFIFDDLDSIRDNPHIRHLWPLTEPMITSPKLAVQGRPVECLTLALNYAWDGLNVRGYHAFNLALHLASALVLFGVLRRTFESERLHARFATPAPWLAAAIALIWEVHPLQTESVTYIVQRSELLMGLFLLLTLYCFIRGVESQDWPRGSAALRRGVEGSGSAGAPISESGLTSPSHEEERGAEDERGSAGASPSKTQRIGWGQPTLHPTRLGTADATPASDRLGQPTLHRARIGWFCLSVVSCLLGMGSKEVMVGAPLIVLLYDRVFLASSFRELWQRRGGLYIGLAATWLLLALLVAGATHDAARFGIKGLTSWGYLTTEAGVILYYLRLCFWPHPLVIDYADWPIASSWQDVLVSGVVILGLLGATVWEFRRRPWLGFLGA